VVECVYLFSQILTTVGYGDIVPARPRAQVFVAVYVVFTLMIIANIFSSVVAILRRHVEEYAAHLREAVSALQTEVETAQPAERLSARSQVSKEIVQERMPALPWKSLGQSFLFFLSWCVLGVVFFMNYPGEGRSMTDAIYMSVITLSTVGFGAYTPLTEAGKVFGAFWMLFGSSSLVALVGSFTELVAAMRTREHYLKVYSELDKSERYRGLPERIDLHDFMRFAMVYQNLAEEDTLELIDKTFNELGPSSDGQLGREDVASMLTKLREASPAAPLEPEMQT